MTQATSKHWYLKSLLGHWFFKLFWAILPSFHIKCYRASQSTLKRKDQSGLGWTEGCFHSDGLTVQHTTQSPELSRLPTCFLSASQTRVHDAANRRWTHFVPFLPSCKILAPPLSLLYSSKAAPIVPQALWDSPEQNPSLNMNSSSCPFFQRRVHASGSSGQHFAWYCLTWGNCLLCRPSPTHEVCVSPWQSWREPCRSLFCITRRHWVCSEKWRGGKSHFNYAMFGII